MVCLYCGSATGVVNSRLQRRTNSTWRRRKCDVCGLIFTTIEQPDLGESIRVKNDKSLIPLIRDRLFISVFESCRHLSEPIRTADHLTRTILAQLLQSQKDGVVDKQTIIKTAHLIINRFDKAAGTIYEAYHRR